MARAPFSLYRRPSSHNRYIYYVQLWNGSLRRYGSGRSVRAIADELGVNYGSYSTRSKTEARLLAERWLQTRKSPDTSKERRFGEYCLEFWDWEKSSYIQAKLLRKQAIGKAYCRMNLSSIRRFLVPSVLLAEKETMMDKYAAWLGVFHDGANEEESKKGREIESLFLNKFPYAVDETENGFVIYLDDKKDAMKALEKAKKIYEKCDYCPDGLYIDVRPHCPKCGYTNKWSDWECPKCKVKMVTEF